MNTRVGILASAIWTMAAIGTMLAGSAAESRTLAEVQARGVISLCANPDALPHSSNKPDAPGFQIEIARALANALGFQLQLEWIIPRVRAAIVNCDMLLDTIAIPDVQPAPVKLSHPYQKSGVALALGAGTANANAKGFRDVAPAHPGMRAAALSQSDRRFGGRPHCSAGAPHRLET